MNTSEGSSQGRRRSGRTCPYCGARVAERARDCFQCGADLTTPPRRRRSVPWADILLLLVIAGVVALWWSRAEEAARAALTPTATPTATATPTITPTATWTPTPTVTPTPTCTPTPIVHTVQPGESPLFIAGEYGVTLESLLAANDLQEGDLIRVGQLLRIPTPTPILGPNGLPVTPTPTSTPDQRAAVYTVQRGDTLVSIAAQFSVTVEAIMTANGLKPDEIIRPGQPLVIPLGTPTVEPFPIHRPTPTPTPGPPWPAPKLLSPPEGAQFSGEEPVLLRWAAVGLLEKDQWYVLRVWLPDQPGSRFPRAWTKGTSFRLPADWHPPADAASDKLCWQVTVTQKAEGGAGEGAEIIAVSPPSEIRCFHWH